jgi:hypothetical protein
MMVAMPVAGVSTGHVHEVVQGRAVLRAGEATTTSISSHRLRSYITCLNVVVCLPWLRCDQTNDACIWMCACVTNSGQRGSSSAHLGCACEATGACSDTWWLYVLPCESMLYDIVGLPH